MRILIVDDSEDSREIVEVALLSGGYREIVPVGSGWDAIKFLDVGSGANDAAPKADIVLLDVLMPEIDGIETCARIRNDPRYVDVPIIMVTSLDDMDSLANAFVAGANDYITKPINRVELIARVRSALKLKAELDRRQARERELLQFLSNWGDKHADTWIDESTGLLVGEIVEAYLTAITERYPNEIVSVLALAVDRLDSIRASQGTAAAQRILSEVAHAVRRTASSIGAIAGCYRNGLIAIVIPEFDAEATKRLGNNLRRSVAQLAIANSESIAADHITASVAVATGHVRNGIDRVQLMTRAIASAQSAAMGGSDHLVTVGSVPA